MPSRGATAGNFLSRPFDDLDLLDGQAIQFVHQRINLPVSGIELRFHILRGSIMTGQY